MHKDNFPLKEWIYTVYEEDKNPVSIWTVDKDFNYTFFNKIHKESMLDIWDAEIELGKYLPDYIKDKEYREEVITAYKKLLKEGSHQSQDQIILKSGREIFYENFGNLLYSADGSISGIVICAVNITQKRKIQENLEFSVSLLESIVNSPEDIHIRSMDKEYRYVFFNEVHFNTMKAIWGIEPEIGKNIFELIPDSTYKKNLKKFYEKALSGKPVTKINPVTLKSGEKRYFEHFPAPIYNEDGKINGITVFSIDRTNEEIITQKMQKAIEEKELLLKEIHHRVKNNLQLISGIINLQMDKIEDPKSKLILQDALTRIDVIGKIHYSLYNNNNISEINMCEYCHKLIESILKLYDQNDLSIKIDIDIPEIHLDIRRAIPISLIMNELITNSIKYAFEDNKEGKISITLKDQGKKGLHLQVKDNGKGITETGCIKKSMGTELISLFVQQLDGIIEYKNDPGLTVDLYF